MFLVSKFPTTIIRHVPPTVDATDGIHALRTLHVQPRRDRRGDLLPVAVDTVVDVVGVSRGIPDECAVATQLHARDGRWRTIRVVRREERHRAGRQRRRENAVRRHDHAFHGLEVVEGVHRWLRRIILVDAQRLRERMRARDPYRLRRAPVDHGDRAGTVRVRDRADAQLRVVEHGLQHTRPLAEELHEVAHRVEIGIGRVVLVLVVPAEETVLVVAHVESPARKPRDVIARLLLGRVAVLAQKRIGIVDERPAHRIERTRIQRREAHLRTADRDLARKRAHRPPPAAVPVVAHVPLAERHVPPRHAPLAERDALFASEAERDEIRQMAVDIVVDPRLARLRRAVVVVPAVDLGDVVEVLRRPDDIVDILRRGGVGRHEADVEPVAAECRVERAAQLFVDVAVRREPAPRRAGRHLVRKRVVADLHAHAHLDEVVEPRGDVLAVALEVEVVRDDRHAPRHEVERRARPAERRVVVVGERVHRLPRPVGKARENTRIGRRDLAEGLQHALVAEFVRHQRQHRRLRVVEPEAAPEPTHARLRQRDLRDVRRH